VRRNGIGGHAFLFAQEALDYIERISNPLRSLRKIRLLPRADLFVSRLWWRNHWEIAKFKHHRIPGRARPSHRD
jgi:hypothetical protein